MITISREQFNKNVIKYLEDNLNKPKHKQTTAYKELEEVLCSKGISIPKFIEYLKEVNRTAYSKEANKP